MNVQHQFYDNINLINIQFHNGVVWVYLNSLGTPFGRLPQDFLKRKSSVNFIALLQKEKPSIRPVLLEQPKSSFWAEERLAIEYAHWLNPALEICLRKCISDFHKTSFKKLDEYHRPIEPISEEEQYTLLVASYEDRAELLLRNSSILKALDSAVEVNQQNGEYSHDQLFSNFYVASEIGLRVEIIDMVLREEGLIFDCGGTWLLCHNHQSYTRTLTNIHLSSFGTLKPTINTFWTRSGVRFIMEVLQKNSKVIELKKLAKKQNKQAA